MITQVAILLASIQLSSQQLPTDLPEQVMKAVAGISTNIEVTCGFNNILVREYWIINGTFYNLYIENYPNVELESLYTLRIANVDICLNDTTFQCVIITSIDQNITVGRVTRLIVVEGKYA